MPLTQTDVEELKHIYREVHGKALTNEEAWAMAHRLVGLYRVLTGTKGARSGSLANRESK